MLKKKFAIASLALVSLGIVGCTVTQPPIQESTDCTRLKRQYIYNTTNENLEAGSITTSQMDAIKQQMEANNCNAE